MPKAEESLVLSLILDGQKELRDDVKGLSEQIYTQNANITNISNQVERVLDTLSEHSERLSSYEAYQQEYYRSRKLVVSQDEAIKAEKNKFFTFSALSTKDLLGLIGLGILSACTISAKLLGLF
jgi:uncharacterized coiled-coil DUF342 family protein